MKISIVGATGMAGSAIVAEALTRGHAVDGFARGLGVVPTHPDLVMHRLDVTGPAALDAVFAESDVGVLAIRFAAGEESRLAPTTTRVLDAAATAGTRVVVIGGAAPLHTPGDPARLVADDPEYVPAAWRSVAQASVAQLQACVDHEYDGWVYLSPPAILEPGARSGAYRRGTSTLLVDQHGDSRITVPDLSIAVVDEIERPGTDRHFTVAAAGA